MPLPVPPRDPTLESMRDSAGRWAGLLRSVPDPNRTAIGYWTVGEVAAHTTHLIEIFTGMVDGRPSPIEDHRRMSEHWDRELSRDKKRDLKVLADRIEDSVEKLQAASVQDRWNEELVWHGGIKIPLYALSCIVVNESELHGLDVARAQSKQWPIRRDKALLAISGLLPILPHFVREDVADGLSATWELRLRGGDRIYLVLREGALEVTDVAPERVDCRVSVDPVEYLLIGYGRKSKWGPILTGKVVSFGRKPWLGLKLPKLFRSV